MSYTTVSNCPLVERGRKMIEIKRENASALRAEMYETLLEAKGVSDVHLTNFDEYGYSRTFKFSVGGRYYEIVWMWNLSELRVADGGMTVLFDRVTQETTWPNRAKSNLHFYRSGEVVAVIPTEYYESEAI